MSKTVTNFFKIIKNTNIPSACKMISYDVQSLFNNVLLDKTTKIIIRKIYQEYVMIFRFSALYPYLLDDIEFPFYLRPIFRLLPCKIDTMKKNPIKTLQTRWKTIQKQVRQKKEVLCEIQQFMV